MIGLLIKASILIVIFWGFYRIFLARESFFTLNRIYLNASLILIFILPFIVMPPLVKDQGWISTVIEQNNLTQSSHAYQKDDLTNRRDYTNRSSTSQNEQGSNYTNQNLKDYLYWIKWIYLFGISVMALNIIVQILSLIFLVVKSEDKIIDTDSVIINSASSKEPGSFFNCIFINPELYDYHTYEKVLLHEKIHVAMLHSLDLLLSEIVVIVLWFNPFAWLMRSEIERNVEFQTDAKMLEDGQVDRKGYQMSLLEVATYKKPLAITNNYNQALVKSRILKMNAKKSNPFNCWKYAFILPMLFLMLLFMNEPQTAWGKVYDDELSNIEFNFPAEANKTLILKTSNNMQDPIMDALKLNEKGEAIWRGLIGRPQYAELMTSNMSKKIFLSPGTHLKVYKQGQGKPFSYEGTPAKENIYLDSLTRHHRLLEHIGWSTSERMSVESFIARLDLTFKVREEILEENFPSEKDKKSFFYRLRQARQKAFKNYLLINFFDVHYEGADFVNLLVEYLDKDFLSYDRFLPYLDDPYVRSMYVKYVWYYHAMQKYGASWREQVKTNGYDEFMKEILEEFYPNQLRAQFMFDGE